VHDRIRAKIGHHLSHPKSIEVDVSAGQVMLRGAIMASEVSCLLSCVRGVPGVRKIEHQLDIYDRPDNQPELQGGRRSGQNALPAFSPSTRLLLGSAGLGLLVFGPAQSFPLACALGMGGLALLAGSATGSQRSWPFLPEMQREGAGRGASRREAPVKKDIRQFEPVEAAV
jgi:hypothetical protein